MAMWVPFTRSDDPPWTLADALGTIGEVREVVGVPPLFGGPLVRWRVLDARLTRDPRRVELLVEPAAG